VAVASHGFKDRGMTLQIAVKKAFAGFALDATFEAPAGVTAIFGRSGSGKTTLINAVAGLVRPDAGRIVVNKMTLFGEGVDVPVHRRRIGYVFQDARLFPHMTVAQNLTYGGRHDHDAVVDLLGLGALMDRRPAKLSGGEKSRVALGRALMCNPQLLLMDEPLAALDAARKAEILPYVEQLRDQTRVPVIYVSHAMSEVARLATTLVILEDGKVRRAGPLDTLMSDPTAVPLIGVREAGAILRGRIIGYDPVDGLSQVRAGGDVLTLPGDIGMVGQTLRLRVLAQDVILSLNRPVGISALNILEARILSIEQGQGPGVAIALQVGGDRLLSRITRRSANQMGLVEGQTIFAIIKTTAIAPQNVGDA
jgi:molybdate transport system ATP-binding protein